MSSILEPVVWSGLSWFSQLIYVSLHQNDPRSDGALASEVYGGGYARSVVGFGPLQNGASRFSNVAVSFVNLPACRITHIGLWNRSVSGDMGLVFDMASTSMGVMIRSAGQGLVISTGQIAISLSSTN